MKITGITDLPLHYGKCPPWLFGRMVKLTKGIIELIVSEYSKEEFLNRLSDPYFFQSLGCVVGFDFHSSGLTTTLCGALKEALKKSELTQEIVVVGGKGKTSRKTPEEIKKYAEIFGLRDKKITTLIKTSKLSAKVDNTALQDGFNLYHHTFVFTDKGNWAIVQQGMNDATSYARRYHWLSNKLDNFKDFVNEPHAAIASDLIVKPLNMVAREASEARKTSLDLIKDNPVHLKRELGSQKTLDSFSMSREHFPKINKLNLRLNFKTLQKAYEQQPKGYEELLLIKGMGPSTIRSLALISNLVYGSKLSWKDPCKYAFAHGGKDGWPYPVNKKRYDKSIRILKQGIEEARVGQQEKLSALKRLRYFVRFRGQDGS